MAADLVERVDLFRLDANRGLQGKRKASLGQFMTPTPIARLMASLLRGNQEEVRLLDAGAGVGSLFAAAIAEFCCRTNKPRRITLSCYEIDPHFACYLSETMQLCRAACEQAGIQFAGEIQLVDFLAAAAEHVTDGLLAQEAAVSFNCAILNPPYRKIRGDSRERQLLRQMEVETSNVYSGFMAAAVQLLEPGGELVAITPRSFCNGSYFRPFRKFFLREIRLRHLHVFESRQQAFRDDEVLQETLILQGIKRHSSSEPEPRRVTVTSTSGPDDEWPLCREMDFEAVVKPADPQSFIHVSADPLSEQIADWMGRLGCTLTDLGLTVSTGRIVDFRARKYLRKKPGNDTVPLIWPTHFHRGYITWPKKGARKPEAIAYREAIRAQLVPNEHYVLVRRFSAKEERRRVVAAVYDAGRVKAEAVGFENHLNYFHQHGRGVDLPLARGLAAFLNSTLLDAYFRQFNGHTQVNATDLRNLCYPSVEHLRAIGKRIGDDFPDQGEVDRLVAEEFAMTHRGGIDAVQVKKRLDEALEVLRALGFPRQQLNDRSALMLLALLGLKPETPWSQASEPLCGITPMIGFIRDYYGKSYKPNARETVRRQTFHQFLDAGLIVPNPDHPERALNGPKAVYQIETSALKLLRAYGSKMWDKELATYLCYWAG